jgi:hypothetical protein
MRFENNFVSNEIKRESILSNPNMLYTIWPTPKHAIDFKFKIPDANTLKCNLIVEYGIIGKFIIPPQTNLSKEHIEQLPGTIFTEIITLSRYDIISDGYFDTTNFEFSQGIEDELVKITTLAVKYNSKILTEKLKGTEISNYKIIEMTPGFIRTSVRQLFFGGPN